MLVESPITDKIQVSPLINAGADILYGGISSELWGVDELNNRRPWGNCNFDSFSSLNEAIDEIHCYGKKFYLTLNEHHYSEEYIEKLAGFIDANKNIDGFIVADICLLKYLKSYMPDVYLIASVGCNVMNKAASDFFADLCVDEIVLPRHLNLNSIKKMLDNSDRLFSIIIRNDDCYNVDGLCCYTHGFFYGLACDLIHDFKIIDGEPADNDKSSFLNNNKEFLNINCLACLIPMFNRIGINTVKIAGRGRSFTGVLKDTFFIRKICDLGVTKNIEVIKKIHEEIYRKKCPVDCFYCG